LKMTQVRTSIVWGISTDVVEEKAPLDSGAS